MTDENDEIDEDGIKQRWEQVGSELDERGRRLWAASEVQAAGHGALKVVSRITGLARSTINRGEDDLDCDAPPVSRLRAAAATRQGTPPPCLVGSHRCSLQGREPALVDGGNVGSRVEARSDGPGVAGQRFFPFLFRAASLSLERRARGSVHREEH